MKFDGSISGQFKAAAANPRVVPQLGFRGWLEAAGGAALNGGATSGAAWLLNHSGDFDASDLVKAFGAGALLGFLLAIRQIPRRS